MNTKILVNNKSLVVESAALTDRGQRRKVNEDAVFHWTEQVDTAHRLGLYMVCDGLGGHQAGEVASHLAVQTVSTELAEVFTTLKMLSNGDYIRPSQVAFGQYIEAAIKKANAEIYNYAQTHPHEAGNLGTTITLVLLYNGLAHIANVGDSRTYVWRDGEVTQITRDHSVAAELAALGKIDESEIPDHPHNHILYRSLGSEDEVDVDLFEWELRPGDKFLLCSDGLWQAFSDTNDLADWFEVALDPSHLCRCLVAEANERYGRDNISAVVVNVDETVRSKVQNLPYQMAPAF